jgi:hypothetical protein
MVQTRQLDGGNNASATMVTSPMQHEGKEVSRIMPMILAQKSNDAHAMLAIALVQQRQSCHCDNGKDVCSSTMAMTPS